MPGSRSLAGHFLITVLVLLLVACGSALPISDVVSDTSAPTESPSTPSGAAPTGTTQIPDAGGPLAGTIWTLESMNGKPPLVESTITLRFAPDGWLGGSDGCYYYSGEVVESPGELRVGPLVATLTGCKPKRLRKQQNAFVEVLQDVSRGRIEGDLLTLTRDVGEELLVFSRQSQDLSGITWTVESFKDALGMGSVLDGTKTALTFNKDGTMTGTANCNDLFGQFTVGDGELQIGPIGMTKKRCSEPHRVMEQELSVIAALEAATIYWVEGDTVQMYQDDGAGVAILIHD